MTMLTCPTFVAGIRLITTHIASMTGTVVSFVTFHPFVLPCLEVIKYDFLAKRLVCICSMKIKVFSYMILSACFAFPFSASMLWWLSIFIFHNFLTSTTYVHSIERNIPLFYIDGDNICMTSVLYWYKHYSCKCFKSFRMNGSPYFYMVSNMTHKSNSFRRILQ